MKTIILMGILFGIGNCKSFEYKPIDNPESNNIQLKEIERKRIFSLGYGTVSFYDRNHFIKKHTENLAKGSVIIREELDGYDILISIFLGSLLSLTSETLTIFEIEEKKFTPKVIEEKPEVSDENVK